MDRKSNATIAGALLVSLLLSAGLKTAPSGLTGTAQNTNYPQASRASGRERATAGSVDRKDSEPVPLRKAEVENLARQTYEKRLRGTIGINCGAGENCSPDLGDFIIALVPDPVHTHLALEFDRMIEAIEQALQDEDFVFDHAVMPWDPKTHPESDDYENRLESGWYENAEQEFPGAMRFRGVHKRAGHWKFVFVVSETPTQGINKHQFLNAIAEIPGTSKVEPGANKSWRTGKSTDPVLRIMGPTFSGSFSSLGELLGCATPKDAAEACNPSVNVYSGTVSGRLAIQAFSQQEHDLNMHFVSFQENDEVMIERFVQFLTGDAYGHPKESRGYTLGDIALLTEDETAYGTATRGIACDTPERSTSPNCILKLYFPREISQLRAAYQDNGAGAPVSDSRAQPRDTLPSNFSVPGSDDDTVAAFSTKQTPLSQESTMLGIVSELRKHRVEYVILRATDPMDMLFLSEYVRTAYPQGRVVIIHPDLLFRRETGDPRLHGMLALSTYSLAPAASHSFASYELSHVERIYPSSTYGAGTYNAMSALLTTRVGVDSGGRHLLVPIDKDDPPYLYQYGAWQPSKDEHWEYAEHSDDYCAPPVHLLALGRDDYWPVANLGPFPGEKTNTLLPRVRDQIKGRHREPIRIPGPWRVVQLAGIALGLGFCFCLWFSSVFSRSEMLAQYAPAGPDSRTTLIGFAGLALFVIMYILLWPSRHGAISDKPLMEFLLWFTLAIVPVFTAFELVMRGAWSADDDRTANYRLVRLFKRYIRPFLFLILVGLLPAQELLRGRSSAAWDTQALTLRFTLLRGIELTSGLSFIMPWFFFLTVWLWWADHLTAGCAVLDERRPRLPEDMHDPRVKRLGEEGRRELRQAYDLGWVRDSLTWAMLVLFIGGFWYLGNRHNPLMSLESPGIGRLMSIFLALSVGATIITTLKLWRTWTAIRRLLATLDSVPLRHGFWQIRGFSWKSIWHFGGCNQEDFERMSGRVRETLVCAINTVPIQVQFDEELQRVVSLAMEARSIAHPFTVDWLQRRRAELNLVGQFGRVQTAIAKVGGAALDYLAWSWSKNKQEGPGGSDDQSTTDPKIRACEQFVCSIYASFLLVMLVRIRAFILAVGGMYVLVLIGVTLYPFEPRGAIQVMLAVLLAFIVTVVGIVFAQIHRDPTLSSMTGTTPGDLGRDFWVRIAGFAALPLFSFFASQFPSVNKFI